MIRLEDAVEYFNNTKEKNLRRFTETTPEGNTISGWICMSRNKHYGSILIDTLNNEPHNQYVQSMPKIKYFEHESDISSKVYAQCYEKLDGSCLIIYALVLDDEVIEIVPKTRGKAVADKNFLDLYSKVDKSCIKDYYSDDVNMYNSLFFELYGILNQHSILHYDTGIDIRLIGEYNSETDFTYNYDCLEGVYNFNTSELLFLAIENTLYIESRKYEHYFRKICPAMLKSYSSHEELNMIIIELLEQLNKVYMEENNRLALEGTVINAINRDGNQKYIKVKPRDIKQKHTQSDKCNASDIRKEVYKYFDEYGSRVDELFREDDKHYLNYVREGLLEDYPVEIVDKSNKKIENIFYNVWDSKQLPQSLHEIASELIEEYGEMGVTHCMRMFAQLYPSKKKEAGSMYLILNSRIGD